MAMGPGALAIDLLVLFLTQLWSRQAMGCREMGADGEKCVHGISEIVGPEARLFVKA